MQVLGISIWENFNSDMFTVEIFKFKIFVVEIYTFDH